MWICVYVSENVIKDMRVSVNKIIKIVSLLYVCDMNYWMRIISWITEWEISCNEVCNQKELKVFYVGKFSFVGCFLFGIW